MEEVLGIERSLIKDLLKAEAGFIDSKKEYNFIRKNLSSKNREVAEYDSSFKQVIPYLIISYEKEILLYKRKKKQNEARLHEKLSIGVGGHINPIDINKNKDVIKACLKRELEEEINIELTDPPKFIGFINDDTNEVGQVHLGLVFFGKVANKSFSVNEDEKMDCKWVSIPFIKENYQSLETWSQIVYNSLLN